MKQLLTFAFDCEINSNEDFAPEGMKVAVATNEWRQHEGFTPVVITEALSFNGKPVTYESEEIIYFMNESFKELR